MGREAIPTWYFALVVVRHEGRFLIVRERRHQQKWFLPAGGVEPGEDLIAAAERETMEEAGIRITVERVVRVEHRPMPDGKARLRVVFLASPLDAVPAAISGGLDPLAAAWVTVDELNGFPLRGEEVRELFSYVAAGGQTYPLEVLAREGAPYPII